MITEKIFFSTKSCFLFFIYFIHLAKNSATELQTCNQGKDLCQPLSECQYYKLHKNMPYRLFTWCNANDFVVCCPQAHLNRISPTYYSNMNRPFIEDCKKWQKQIYSVCPPEGLIVSGRNAVPKEFPHMALIGLKMKNEYNWLCGGSLINPRYVLTAAHCMEVEEIPTHVRLGELNYNRTDDDTQIQEFTIKDYTAHPNYDPEESYYDIAVVELNGIAQINSYVVPICLPVTNGSENGRLVTAGWGTIATAYDKSPLLQKVILERFEDEKCQEVIGKTIDYADGLLPDYQICAGSWTDSRDTCQGDSGGPLFIEHPDLPCMYIEHGITSFGKICGKMNVPGVYTRVFPYVDWIESIVWNSTLQKN